MAGTAWKIRGEYFETCNCEYLCPCIVTNMTARPTKGQCYVALAFHVEAGTYGDLGLDDLSFVVVAHTPGPMYEGNWTVGLIVDERASAKQLEALTAIATGQAGGPMENLGPLIGKLAGVETKPVQFRRQGNTASVTIAGALDQAVAGVESATSPDEPIYLDNTLHPANTRLALGKATRSHVHIFGIDWDDNSGENNGHYAPFSWSSAAQ